MRLKPPLHQVDNRGTLSLTPSNHYIEERVENAGDIFLIPFLDGHLFYNPLANLTMLLDQAGAGAVQKYFRREPLSVIEQKLVGNLADKGIFDIPPEQDHSCSQDGSGWAPTRVTFSNTQKCSLRCTYCYSQGGRLNDLDIPLDVARAAIDLIIANAEQQEESPAISFLGEGEATSSWNTFERIIAYFQKQCQDKNLSGLISLSTNCVFPHSRLDFIAQNCTNLTCSLDGVREVHDASRILPGGQGSFDRVISTLKGLEIRGKSYDIRCTVTAAGSAHLSKFAQFVGQNLGCKSIHAEPVFHVSEEGEQLDAQQFLAHFRQARQAAATHGIDLFYSGSAMKQRRAFCGSAAAHNFLITTRGIVTSCNEVLEPSDIRAGLFHYGSWDRRKGRFIIDREAVRRLEKLNLLTMPKCHGCMAKYNCAGGCYAKSASRTGDPADETAYTERCIITRELLKDNLLMHLISDKIGINRDRGKNYPICAL